ncbi:alcohol dehydrogenase catalytic domain-containing protein [Agrobacterium leguminum]|uniref:alcohol dehydrogenase catalytic domain-containing protein n=1 Tax=Agrobacterium leguminum TaxID=2792015 RepID=UPI0019D64117|nr:alcohol dehydrogenase catalytic domain-containing protein [Agrobacterium leguminum]
MKAWLLRDFGLDNLELGEVPTPEAKPGELLIKVGGASLNFRDRAIVEGFYEPHLVPKPLIPVSDVAGNVFAVGDGVTRFKVGDRVNSHPLFAMARRCSQPRRAHLPALARRFPAVSRNI